MASAMRAVARDVSRVTPRPRVSATSRQNSAVLEHQARAAERSIAAPVADAVASSSDGAPLPRDARVYMERTLGHDFGAVRVHANAQAAESARGLHAQAYTIGHDVVFGAGAFAPHTLRGARLLAHELTHVAQQRGTEPHVQCKSADEEIDEELAAGNKATPNALNPNDEAYAYTLREYGFKLTHDEHSALLTKPTAPAEVAAWEAKFKKAGILADRILKAGPKVTDKESRAGSIAQDLAEAGFLDRAMGIAAALTADDQKKFVFTNVLTQPGKMTAAHATTITTFFNTTSTSIDVHPVMVLLRDRTGDYSKALQTDKLTTILGLIVGKYSSDASFTEAMSEILIFYKPIRAPFATLMNGAGKGAQLFSILRSPFFADEDQADRKEFADKAGSTKSLDRETDQAWVVAEKQKYYVNYLITLAAAQKIVIVKPAAMSLPALRTWLDANTESIGAALKAGGTDAAQVYREIADIFFYHVTQAEGDVKPDLGGKLAKLQAGTPQKLRLKSDCDVLASYAMRLLTASGMQPVLYMAIVPTDTAREPHALALMLKGAEYQAISNKTIAPLTGAKTEADALIALRDAGIAEAYATPAPSAYAVYVGKAGAKGELPQGVIDSDAALRRANLEPSGGSTP